MRRLPRDEIEKATSHQKVYYYELTAWSVAGDWRLGDLPLTSKFKSFFSCYCFNIYLFHRLTNAKTHIHIHIYLSTKYYSYLFFFFFIYLFLCIYNTWIIIMWECRVLVQSSDLKAMVYRWGNWGRAGVGARHEARDRGSKCWPGATKPALTFWTIPWPKNQILYHLATDYIYSSCFQLGIISEMISDY